MAAHISDTVQTLTELVHGNVANEGRLRDAAHAADEPMNQRLLNHFADKRSELAEELQAHAAAFGKVPDIELTVVDHLGRVATKFCGVVTGDETESLLEKAAECEKELHNEYREALTDENVAPNVKAVLKRQVADTSEFSTVIRKIGLDERVIQTSRNTGL